MKKILTTLIAMAAVAGSAMAFSPNKIIVPNIEGYKTLKADFHIHTVFSDADVWPSTRVQEAQWEGLDVIAITDHVDSRLQRQVSAGRFTEKCDRNEAFRIAKAAAGKKLIVIHGGEISRGMPPGHWNTLFIEDGNKVFVEAETAAGKEGDHMKATEAGLKEAYRQGGWCQWNHPHWERQAPNETIWHKEHTKLYDAGLMKGIEVYNGLCGVSEEAFDWALEKGITITAGSDCHKPFFTYVDYLGGEHRPVTLVFASERNEAGVREALENRRTAILAENTVWGEESLLKDLLKACLKMKAVKSGEDGISFTFENKTSFPIRLKKSEGSEKYTYLKDMEVRPLSTKSVKVSANQVNNHKAKISENHVSVNFEVENFRIGHGKTLHVTYEFDIE